MATERRTSEVGRANVAMTVGVFVAGELAALITLAALVISSQF